MNHTAEARFELARQVFQKRFPPKGRQAKEDMPISLDFELELIRMHGVITPALMMVRGDVKPDEETAKDMFPNASRWFKVGIDGDGFTNKKRFRQKASLNLVELETVTMSPQQFLDSTMFTDLRHFADQHHCNRADHLRQGPHMEHSHSRLSSKLDYWGSAKT